MPELTSIDQIDYSDPWMVEENLYNVQNLINGQDYSQTIVYNQNDFGHSVTITWNFPSTPRSGTPYSFPDLIYGNDSWWNQVPSFVDSNLPAKISTLTNATINYNLSVTGAAA